jgi:hypothetical protein
MSRLTSVHLARLKTLERTRVGRQFHLVSPNPSHAPESGSTRDTSTITRSPQAHHSCDLTSSSAGRPTRSPSATGQPVKRGCPSCTFRAEVPERRRRQARRPRDLRVAAEVVKSRTTTRGAGCRREGHHSGVEGWKGRWKGDDYQRRFDDLASGGADVHGEAAFVMRFEPRTVLDAGCGTGRVGIELSRRGIDVVGVDVEPSMLAVARGRAPDVEWVESDLAELDLGRTFDVVVMTGNVPLFTPEGYAVSVHRRTAAAD